MKVDLKELKIDLREMICLLSKGPDEVYYYFDDCALYSTKGRYRILRREDTGNPIVVPDSDSGIDSELTRSEFGRLTAEYVYTKSVCARLSRWGSSLLDQPYSKVRLPGVVLQESLKNRKGAIRYFDRIEPGLLKSGYRKVFNGARGECRVYVTGASPYVAALEKIYFS